MDKNGEFIGTAIMAILETIENINKHGVNVGHYEYNKTSRSWKIDTGLFTGNFGQILLKWTWNLPNTLIGNIVGHTLNYLEVVDNVTNFDGAVALSNVTRKGAAFTIGNYIFGPENFKADWRDHTFVHEYGHYIQSNWFGPFYLPVIGSTSLLSAGGLGKPDHEYRWFEVQASKMGGNYFDKKYGSGKNGYSKLSPDYFDKQSYEKGGIAPYLNTRTGTRSQFYNPISGAQFSGWDVVIPILSLGSIFGLFLIF